jgi:hypothetical protein
MNRTLTTTHMVRVESIRFEGENTNSVPVPSNSSSIKML